MRRLLFQSIHDVAPMLDREQAGREARLGAGALDSQTVKAPHALGGGGYEQAPAVMVHLITADVQDASEAEQIVAAVCNAGRG